MKKSIQKHFPKWTFCRYIVQISIILLFVSPLILVKVEGDNFFFGTLTSSQIFGIQLSDPFSAIQVSLAAMEMKWSYLSGAIIILTFYMLIKGRAFCSWVCPLNTLLELVDKIRKYINLPDIPLDKNTKLYNAVVILILSTFLGIPIFEIFSPIGNIMRTMVFTTGIGLWIIVAIVLFDLLISRRGWCRYLCPLGGMYQSIGNVGLFSVKFDHTLCTGCDRCRSICLSDPEILEAGINRNELFVSDSDCSLCGKCVDKCPVEALSITIKKQDTIKVDNLKKCKERFIEKS
ncbi:NapH/MauN family ferredoxin-type protein [Bacillus sp. Marseille-P3661]|uniref:NapH/MauN family ferredoxin-type protein n=1 Tax=Bacillus sp. Marseille-P3661 TaxID=1936234 RepID=UPI000C855882|nr:NapH/MauN family ferredoxin-type protein [Bacillus sp. Marseille-P3661]